MHLINRLAFLCSVCLFIFASSAFSQTTATISGTITDTTGGVLPGVRVTIQQTETGLVRAATTSSDGRFVFAGIPVGRYTVRGELPGFRSVARQDLVVTVGQTLAVPLVMEVGAVEQTV